MDSVTDPTSASGRPPGSVTEMARAVSGSLAPGETRVVNALLALGPEVIHASVTEVAALAQTSVGTVVRASQSLGFKGFQAAKIALAQDLRPRDEGLPTDDIAAGDEPAAILAKLASGSADALRGTTASVDGAQLAAAVRTISDARRVLFLGVGTSAPLAQDAAYRLSTIGVDAQAPADVHVQHVCARLLRPGDVGVAVSHTGATKETLGAARAAKEAGATVIAVTSFSTTPLTTVADLVLVAGARETNFRVEAMASRMAHLLVLDALYTGVLLHDSERARVAQLRTADVLAEHRF
ncbi:MurR/RpiR family transcriptional regulator [Dactylosporangium sp. CA-092794]|uniref:MurR/RpiR family transcriptional regulator n=1 Tax=Dactylosporangium sp. CA-092794 TaxID=3239929 RepID=UPI003D8A4E32